MNWVRRQMMRPSATATPLAVAAPHRCAANSLCGSAPLRDENSSRISRTVREIKTTTYIWDNWNIIREIVREGDSVAVTDNIWGLDLDGTLQGAGGVGGLLAVVRDDGVFLPTYDANGNVSEYISTNGEIVAHYDYDFDQARFDCFDELGSVFRCSEMPNLLAKLQMEGATWKRWIEKVERVCAK